MDVAHTDTATLTSKKDLQHQPLLEGSSTSRKSPSLEALVDSSNSVAKTDTSLFVTSKRTTPTTMKAERFEALTYMQNSIDLNVNPCEDFYQFACGKWNTSYHLPNSSLEVNMFSLIETKTFNEIKALLEAPAKDEEQPSLRNTRKYFTSCMNEGLIDQMGYDTLKEILLQEFEGWPLTYSMWDESKFDLEATVKNLNSYNVSTLFYFTADSDLMNNSYRTLQIGRGDFETIDLIGVTQKDLIFKNYGTLITEVARLLGPYTYNVSVLMEDVKAMVQLEIDLASLKEGSEGYTTLKSLVDTSHTMQQFQVFDWMKYVTIVMSASEVAVNDVNENEKILLKDVIYLPGMVGVISKTTNRTLANYLVWKFILTCIKAMTLPRRFFDLYEEYLSPIMKIGTTDRSRLCTSTTSNIYMYAVAQMFVSEHFDGESNKKARDLIKEIQKSTDWALEMNEWMDRKTKIFAKEKLKLMDLEIGYPEELENDEYLNHLYINYAPQNELYIWNYMKVMKEITSAKLRMVRESLDLKSWTMSPVTSAVAHILNRNQVIIPAGVLRYPLFHKNYPKSVNYGAIGVLMTREILHGFDSIGAKFNQNGHLQDWWSENTRRNFTQKIQCLTDQLNKYFNKEINARVNQKLNKVENSADNGAIKIAYKAYRSSIEAEGKEEPILPSQNLTHNRMFFLSFAQTFCSEISVDYLKYLKTFNRHRQDIIRVNAAIQNSPEFADVYSCPLGSPMNPKNKCFLW
ncbi:neprilysin-1-like isoform X3 [Biomphalaria glabrata]|nr:neprilysin-1-like isoform X3 [Biomphalaria glabrata]